VKLPHVPAWNARRREVAARYDQLFVEAGLAGDPLARPGGAGTREAPTAAAASSAAPITLPAPAGDAHVYHQYVIRAHDGARDALRQHLAAAGIGTQVYYPIPLHLQPCFGDLGYRAGDLPVAELLASEVLALPMHPDLTATEQERVVDAVARFFARGGRASGTVAATSSGP
jgi:dTDP-4-amino-4,6-dideoxygalactose transaminase